MHSIPIAEDDAPPSLAEPAIDLSSDLRGRVLSGRYELAELFCHGELGSVYLGHDQHSGRPVEIKILAPAAASAGAVERFRERSRRMLGLAHPGIAAVYAEGITENGLPFVVVEHREGRNLHHMHGDSRLAWPAPEAILRQLAEALAALHAAGVVHGAVSPGNIVWVEDGPRSPQVQLVDREFRAATPDADVAASLGAQRSQTAGGEPDPGVDLYALGAMVHELCTGHLPDDPNAPSGMRQADAPITVPPGFEAVIVALVDRDPAVRPQSALALLDLIDRSSSSGIDAGDLEFLAALGESPGPSHGSFHRHPPPSQPMPQAKPLAPAPAAQPVEPPVSAAAAAPRASAWDVATGPLPDDGEEVAPALFVLDDPNFSPGGSLPSQHADPVEPAPRQAVEQAVLQAVAHTQAQEVAPEHAPIGAAESGLRYTPPASPARTPAATLEPAAEPVKQRIKPQAVARATVPADASARRLRIVAAVLGVVLLAVIVWRVQSCGGAAPVTQPAPVVAPVVPPAPVAKPVEPSPPREQPTAVATPPAPTVTPTPTITPPPSDPPATPPTDAAAPSEAPVPTDPPPETDTPTAAGPTDGASDGALPDQLSASEFRRLMLRSNRSQAVRTCYRRHARPGEEEVAIVATVSAAGRVNKLRLDPAIPLADCLRGVVLALEFPPAVRSAKHNFIFKNMTAGDPG